MGEGKKGVNLGKAEVSAGVLPSPQGNHLIVCTLLKVMILGGTRYWRGGGTEKGGKSKGIRLSLPAEQPVAGL